MGVVDGLSKARMLAIEAASVIGGSISSGHLILTKHDGSTIDAGNVVGPAASISNGAPPGPIGGQMFFDTANLAGLTDLMAGKNPSTSVANWTAYGYGYDTAVGFSTVTDAVRLSWGGSAGNHFAGINITGLSPGESYLGLLKVRVPALSPDIYFTVGYKTSGHKMSIKDQDVTLLLAFTADGTSAAFGVEAQGVTGYCDVKGMSVYVANQRGFPNYIWDGSGWVETMHMAQKGDIYSRVNTFGDQTISGNKTLTGTTNLTGQTNLKGGTKVGDQTNDAWALIDAPSGKYKGIYLTTGGTARWALLADNVPETGANAGADFGIARYSDAGAYINSPLIIDRESGDVNIGGNLYSGGLAASDFLRYKRAMDISGTDLNNLVNAGFYNGSGMTNAPDGAWYYVEVLMHSNFSGATPTYMVQRATHLTAGSPVVYQRAMTGAGAWNSWYRIDAVGFHYPEAWTAVTFQNSWANYGAPYQTCQYRKIGDQVQLRGLIRSGTVGTTAFTLPAGYRPPATELLVCGAGSRAALTTSAASAGTAHTHTVTQTESAGRVDIANTGTVTINTAAGNAWISLSGIEFSVS